jgi:hypothetical protein
MEKRILVIAFLSLVLSHTVSADTQNPTAAKQIGETPYIRTIALAMQKNNTKELVAIPEATIKGGDLSSFWTEPNLSTYNLSLEKTYDGYGDIAISIVGIPKKEVEQQKIRLHMLDTQNYPVGYYDFNLKISYPR